MGRIKGFFCSCLDNGADYSTTEPTFDRNLDVSHLATPHITPVIDRQTTKSTSQATAEDKYTDNKQNSPQQQRLQQRLQQPQYNDPNDRLDVQSTSEQQPSGRFIRPPSSPNHGNASPSQSSPSSSFAPSPSNNLYEPPQHNNQAQNPPESQNQNNQHASNDAAQQQHPPPPPPIIQPRNSPSTSNGTTAKLSYDIISVREPLAKILAERQQLLQSQQQQRQIMGDHEYIEVYGERGSSCFYEEIAGSVTSSVTYDQIGAVSNHNYQVLINAYAVANRQPAGNQADDAGDSRNPAGGQPDSNNNQHEENAYDVTSHPNDQVDAGPSSASTPMKVPNSVDEATTDHPVQTSPGHLDNARLAQSIPVYSVINKATRRSSSIMRKALESARPPEPPPKNLFISQQPSTSAMTSSNNGHSNPSRARSPVPQIPSTSSYAEVRRDLKDSNNGSPGNKNRNSRLPQPPPRYSKHNAFNHSTDRPLPSPNNLDGLGTSNNNNNNVNNINNNNNAQAAERNTNEEDDDSESVNNGYEMLKSNFDDDQIDVGYEKIREPNRYSGGSISSQLYSRQFIDNGGYESVQPIYSSPSNCYEVLTPATVSEIAAAAVAKLNVIEKSLKKDQ